MGEDESPERPLEAREGEAGNGGQAVVTDLKTPGS